MTHVGSIITAKGVRPKVKYQHKFATTYLYGSYSPIDGDSFVFEIDAVNTNIFETYLKQFSLHRPNQTKIVVIDNAGFHSTKNIEVPSNIILLRIPPYSPELNPCEQIWAWIKNRYKNKVFTDIDQLKNWLHAIVQSMKPNLIKAIVSNHHYLDAFKPTY